MKKLKKTAIQLWQDEKGQGTAEYVLILVAIIAVGVIFKRQIGEILSEKLGKVGKSVSDF